MKVFSFLLVISVTITSYGQHMIVMKSGKKKNGVVMEIKHDTLWAYIDRDLKAIPLIGVSSIFFNEHVAYDGSFDPKEPEKTVRSGNYTISYRMKGRTITTPPVISNATENRGIVVVKVKIDKYGNVLTSKSGEPGSTTTNKYLYIKAEFAAKGTKFNEHPTGPVYTEGTITIAY